MSLHMRLPLTDNATLTTFLHDSSLIEALQNVAASIRKDPASAAQRLLYFDLLCLTGAWEKALPALQNAVLANNGLTPLAYVYRQLVQAEVFRAAVFAGQHAPSLPEPCPVYAYKLWQAVQAEAKGHTAEADSLREAALSACPDTGGTLRMDRAGAASEQNFHWLADSDTRLGPVLEVFVQGAYHWLPLAHVRRMEVQAPRSLRDLMWLPVTLSLKDGECTGFVPGRYAGSEKAGDALALGRETCWENVGQTGVFALGQKTLTSDAGDVPLYDLRCLTLECCA